MYSVGIYLFINSFFIQHLTNENLHIALPVNGRANVGGLVQNRFLVRSSL